MVTSISINIGSGYGLLPGGTEPSEPFPEPMLTYDQYDSPEGHSTENALEYNHHKALENFAQTSRSSPSGDTECIL